jgi:adenylylsulfate kinase
MKITKSRSLVKSFTWRIVAIAVTFICIYILSGQIKLASTGTLLTNSINFVLYYFHERLWDKVQWGRK